MHCFKVLLRCTPLHYLGRGKGRPVQLQFGTSDRQTFALYLKQIPPFSRVRVSTTRGKNNKKPYDFSVTTKNIIPLGPPSLGQSATLHYFEVVVTRSLGPFVMPWTLAPLACHFEPLVLPRLHRELSQKLCEKPRF